MSEQRVRISLKTPPHSDKQMLIMNAFAIPGLLEMWVACGSKFGKTLSASTALCSDAPLNGQSLYRWVAPIYTQSSIGFKYCKRMLPPEPYTKPNESSLSISFPGIDTQIQFFHGQYPESLEGEATAGTILDEAAKMKEQVYLSSKTTTGVTKGPIIGISTPVGKNWFYRKCMEAKEEMIRARVEKRRPSKIFIHAPSTDNPTLSKEVLDDARKTMPDRLFRQYYLADFLDSGSVFINVQNCYNSDLVEVVEQFQWYQEGFETREVVIGVDWARNVDFTVFTASCPKTREVVGIWRMNGVGYPSQVKRLITFSKKFKDCLTVWHDKTGVGIALDDMLDGTDLPFRGHTFSNASKNELMVGLMLAFEEVSYRIPQIDKLIAELDGIEVKTTLTGLPTYNAGSGGHDDLVMSLALSHAAMLQHVDREYGILEF